MLCRSFQWQCPPLRLSHMECKHLRQLHLLFSHDLFQDTNADGTDCVDSKPSMMLCAFSECMYLRMYVPAYVCTSGFKQYVFMYPYNPMYEDMCVHIYIYICTYNMCNYTYTSIYTYVHTHICNLYILKWAQTSRLMAQSSQACKMFVSKGRHNRGSMGHTMAHVRIEYAIACLPEREEQFCKQLF